MRTSKAILFFCFLRVCTPMPSLLQSRLLQRDPLGDQHRLSHFPQKEVRDAGSQLPAPSRSDVVDSGGRVCGTLLGWHSRNMHISWALWHTRLGALTWTPNFPMKYRKNCFGTWWESIFTHIPRMYRYSSQLVFVFKESFVLECAACS